MRVLVLGSGGKVGREVIAQIEAASDMVLAGAITGHDGAALDCHPLRGDVLVDFSSPAAVMQLLDRVSGNPLPLVIGTTGFTPDQTARLRAEGTARPILVAANFTLGFGAFRAALLGLAQALPDAGLTLAETYNAAKKPAASGTTQALGRDLTAIRDGATPEIEINRIGDTPGITALRLDLGVAEIALSLTVHSRAAYAAGALQAARWLIGQNKGFYSPADMMKKG